MRSFTNQLTTGTGARTDPPPPRCAPRTGTVNVEVMAMLDSAHNNK